jgi:transposase
VNSASYCEFMLKLRDAIRIKASGQLARGLLLNHDNATPHTARATQERIQELQRELLEHPPYSPDMTPSDFHLFRTLRKPPWRQMFCWWRKRLKRRRGSGWDNSQKRLLCCRFWPTDKVTGQASQCWWVICREINVFFQVRISHVLRFISIFDLSTLSFSYISPQSHPFDFSALIIYAEIKAINLSFLAGWLDQ